MKLSEQKRMYSERTEVIGNRQIATLSNQGDRGKAAGGEGDDADTDSAPASAKKKKADDTDKDDSDEDSDDEGFAATLADEMVDRSEANQLVVTRTQL